MREYPLRNSFSRALIVVLIWSAQLGCHKSSEAGKASPTTIQRPTIPSTQATVTPVAPAAHVEKTEQAAYAEIEIHYSPEEDLEEVDSGLLAHAQHEIDISAYSLTDPEIGIILRQKAAEGVFIRVYSDRSSAKAELTRARGSEAVIQQLAQTSNIQVRVKRSSELAHMKAYEIDGLILRTGSANFSPDAERRQDNDLIIIRNPTAVASFRRKFLEMWERPDNDALQ
jgi:phosphatidylserine/phosphatidylglycerophosphate/cardiolipin synthase-like enzyme